MGKAMVPSDEVDRVAGSVGEFAPGGFDAAVDGCQKVATAVGDAGVMDADLATVRGGRAEVKAEGSAADVGVFEFVVEAGGFEADAPPLAGDAVVGQGDVGVKAVEAVATQGNGAILGSVGLECTGYDEFSLVVEVERGAGGKCECGTRSDDEAVEDKVGAIGSEGSAFSIGVASAEDVYILSDGLQEDKLADSVGIEKDGILNEQRSVGVICAGGDLNEHAQAVAFPKVDTAEGVAFAAVYVEAEAAAPAACQCDRLDAEVFAVWVVDKELLRGRPDSGEEGVEGEGVGRKREPERRVGGVVIDPLASGCDVE